MDLSYVLAATTLEKIQNKNAGRISDKDVKDYLTALISDLKTVAHMQRKVITNFDAVKQKDEHLWKEMNKETISKGINWTLVSPFQHEPTKRDLKRICTNIQELFSQAVDGIAEQTQGKPKKPKNSSTKKGGKDIVSDQVDVIEAISSALKILHDTKGQAVENNDDKVHGKPDKLKTSSSKKENKYMESTISVRTETDMVSELLREVNSISSEFKKMQGEIENASRRLEKMATLTSMRNDNYNTDERPALNTNTTVPSPVILRLHMNLNDVENLIRKQMKKIKVNEAGSVVQMTGLSYEDALREIDSLQTRLSAFASARLTNNNPIFADLSDPNRPMNLKEQFSNLYAQERLYAYEKLYNQGQEESVVANTLLTIFKEVFDFCRDKRERQKRVLRGIIFHPNRDVASYHDQNVTIPKNEVFEKHLSDAVKFGGEMAAENIAGAYLETKASETDVGNQIRMIETYVKQCAKLCWLTQVQTPPVYIDLSARHGDQFNNATYTEYKHTGKYINFVAWPPILLHENGPLLATGVAEGM